MVLCETLWAIPWVGGKVCFNGIMAFEGQYVIIELHSATSPNLYDGRINHSTIQQMISSYSNYRRPLNQTAPRSTYDTLIRRSYLPDVQPSLQCPFTQQVLKLKWTSAREPIFSSIPTLTLFWLRHCPSRILPVLLERSVTVPSFQIGVQSAILACPYLDEPDILTLFPETLTAKVETIFTDEASRVCADTTVGETLGQLAFVPVQLLNGKARRGRNRLRCTTTQQEGASERASELIPGSRTLAELAWAAVPDAFVRHCDLRIQLGG